MTVDIHIVAKGDDDLLDLLRKLTGRCKNESLTSFDANIDFLENGYRESSGFASSGLSLSDDIVAFNYGDDGTLLDSGRALETKEDDEDDLLAFRGSHISGEMVIFHP